MATRAVPPLRVLYIFGHFGPTRAVPSAPNDSYLYSAVRGPSGDPAQEQFKYRAILRRLSGTWRLQNLNTALSVGATIVYSEYYSTQRPQRLQFSSEGPQ